MTTFQDLIEECRDQWLMTGAPDEINVLHLDVAANDTTLTFRHAVKDVTPGTRISIGLEDYHVIDVSGSNPESTVTVIPGFNGSTPLAHSAGDIIRVRPQFSDWRIGRAINRCISALHSDGLFRIRPLSFNYSPAQAGYNLAADDMLDVWRVRFDYPGPTNDWPVLGARDYYVDQAPDATEFPGGVQLVLRVPGYPGFKVLVSYRASFAGPLTLPADDVLAVTGLHDSAHEIPPLGAAFRLLAGRDIKRSFLSSQPEPRRAQEVPPGSATNAAMPIIQAYYAAIEREVAFLEQKYPRQL